MWNIPKMWEGGEAWIIGGGPSVPYQFNVPEDIIQKVLRKELDPSTYSPYLSCIHNKHVIGVNMAYKIGMWIDIIFFGDGGFYLKNREDLASFPGLVVSCNSKVNSKIHEGDRVKFIQKDNRTPRGLTTRKNCVSWNGNSGAAAINLAVQLGVKKIMLLGFDMNLGPTGGQHWHSLYASANRKDKSLHKLPFHRHMLGFGPMKKQAHKLGIEILNVNPNSAINEFKKVELKDLI